MLPFSDLFSSRRDGFVLPTVQHFNWLATVACLSALGIILILSFGPPIDRKLIDFFHEGEILASWPILEKSTDVPILIHGPGRNLLPAALAALFAQSGQEIIFMRFVTGVGALLTVLMAATATYVFSFALLAGLASTSRRHMTSSIVSLAAASGAVLTAHVSNRHVLFLSALALAAGIIHAADRKPRQAHILAACFGVVCALSPIHVYSTSVMTAAIAAIAAGILLFRFGISALKLIGTALAGLMICIALVLAFGGGGLYLNAIRDIMWWGIDARGIWTTPLIGSKAMVHTTVIVWTIALTGYQALHTARSNDHREQKQSALWLLMTFAVVVATRDMMDRSDSAHTGMTFLTVVVGLGALVALPVAELSRRWPRSLAAVAISVALVIGIGGGSKIYSPQQIYLALNKSDESIFPEDIKAFAQQLEAELSDAHCLLVLTNEGVLNYVVNLPPCGDFFYPIYAGVPVGDQALANWLRANPQKVVVIETPFWSDKIDGKPMKNRLPKVWALIKETMKLEERIGGRVVAKRP